jgi:hypothetical protein
MGQVVEHLEEVNAVASYYIKGLNESEISKELDIPRARVSSLLREWKTMASNSEAVRSRAREALSAADTHYSGLVKQAYEVIDEANQNGALSVKNQAIKLILDIESKRIEMLQKAGLLENKELSDQLIETEKKQALLMKILTEVSSTCKACKPQVLKRLSEASGDDGEAIVIYES